MDASLRQLRDDLYAAFETPAPEEVIGCPCCSDPATLRPLVEIPLRELSAASLDRYAFSALLTIGGEDDLRYFWPRLVELALRDELETEREVLFDKPRLANWRTTAAQQRVTMEVARAVIRTAVSSANVRDIDRWVCAVGRFVDDIVPYLDPLLEPSARQTLRAWYDLNEPFLRRDRLRSEYWGHHPNASRLREWFETAEVLGLARANPSAG